MSAQFLTIIVKGGLTPCYKIAGGEALCQTTGRGTGPLVSGVGWEGTNLSKVYRKKCEDCSYNNLMRNTCINC